MARKTISEIKLDVLYNLESSFCYKEQYKEDSLQQSLTALHFMISREPLDTENLFFIYNMAAISKCLSASWTGAYTNFNETYDYGPDDYYSKIASAFCILHELELTGYQDPRLTSITYDACLDAIQEYMKISSKTDHGYIENRLQAFLLICLLTAIKETISNHQNLDLYLKNFAYPKYKKDIREIYTEVNSLAVDFIKKYISTI